MAFVITTILVALFASWNHWDFLHINRFWPDEAYYAWLAKRLLIDPSIIFSKEIISFHPPLFAVFLAIGTFMSSTVLACRKVLFVIYLLGIGTVFGLGRQWKDMCFASVCAVLLCLNPYYSEFSSIITMDTSLVLFGLILMWLLLNLTKSSRPISDFLVGLVAVVLIGLKWTSVLVIPYVALCYVHGLKGLSNSQRLKRLLTPLSMMCVVVAGLLVNNSIQLGHVMPSATSFDFSFNVFRLGVMVYQVAVMIQIPFIPLFLYGLVKLYNGCHKRRIIVLGWFVIFLLGLFFNAESNSRFFLLLLPATLIITATGVQGVIDVLSKQKDKRLLVAFAVLAFVILISSFSFDKTISKIKAASLDAVGYKAAGLVLKERATDKSLVLSVSPRQIRYFSDINFKEFGGQLVWLNSSHTREAFERMVDKGPDHILLEIDVWDQHRPLWSVYTNNHEFGLLADYLSDLNFKLIHIVEHRNGDSVTPAVLIFER